LCFLASSRDLIDSGEKPNGCAAADFSVRSYRTLAVSAPERRKEAISWKTHFPGVANVVKVIWFRFRISVARELPLSTKHGFAPTRLACTTLKSVMVTSLSTSLLAMAHFTRIVVGDSREGAYPLLH